MTLTILNREFKHPADGWYPIESPGYFPGIADDGRKIVQVIDSKAITSIVNRFNAAATAGSLPHGNEMLIDREHFRHHTDLKGQKDMDSTAYGWIKSLRVGADGGLEMSNRWTGVGQQAVDTGEYRFLSTEYDETNPGDVWQPVPAAQIPAAVRNKYPGWEFMRPLQLTGLSLTNDNNNKGVKPLTILNKKTFAGSRETADSTANQPKENKKMKTVCTLLGLSADADEASVHAAVTSLKNRITVLEPMEAEVTQLKNRHAEFEAEQCDALMDAHGLKTDAPQRATLKPVLLGMKNRADRVAFLADCVAKPAAAGKPGQVQLHNRDTKPPGSSAAPATEPNEDEQKATALKIRNRAEELQGKGLKFDVAWRRAQQDIAAGK